MDWNILPGGNDGGYDVEKEVVKAAWSALGIWGELITGLAATRDSGEQFDQFGEEVVDFTGSGPLGTSYSVGPYAESTLSELAQLFAPASMISASDASAATFGLSDSVFSGTPESSRYVAENQRDIATGQNTAADFARDSPSAQANNFSDINDDTGIRTVRSPDGTEFKEIWSGGQLIVRYPAEGGGRPNREGLPSTLTNTNESDRDSTTGGSINDPTRTPFNPAYASAPRAPADWTTVTEWAVRPADPRLIQPWTHIDTGNMPANFVLNKVLVPWANLLGSIGNIPLATALGVDDAMRHSSQFAPTWQAAQDIFPLEGAMDLTMEVGPALEYAADWLSTNQTLQSIVRAPAFLFVGAGGFGGDIPKATSLGEFGSLEARAETSAAEEALQTFEPGLQPGGPAVSPSDVSTIRSNSTRGREFEEDVVTTFNLPRNNKKGDYTTLVGVTRKGDVVATVPDVYGGGVAAIGDTKDVLRLSFTEQLQAQFDAAKATGTSFNVIVGPRVRSVYGPVAEAARSTDGFIFRVDTAARTVDVWDASVKSWIPFLGGSW